MAGQSWVSDLFRLASVLFLLFSIANAFPKTSWENGARSRLARSSFLNKLSKRSVNASAECVASGPEDFQAPHPNVWAGLTDIEAANVTRWLFQHSGLNLTNSSKAGPWDNALLLVELNIPNKTDVLPYIDGNATAPERWAHAVLAIQATEEPTYSDILVGPLPIDNIITTWMPLEYPYTRKTGGSIRNLDADYGTAYEFYQNISASIADITLELWNATSMGLQNDSLSIWGIDPVWQYVCCISRVINMGVHAGSWCFANTTP